MMENRCGTHYVTNCSASPFFLAFNRSFGVDVTAADWNDSLSPTRTLLPADGLNFQTGVELYAIGILVVFGLFGNVVSVAVLRRYRERRDSLFLLQALAVADGLYLLAAGLRYPLKYVLAAQDKSGLYVEMQLTVFPLLKTFQTVTIWTMVMVTIDRYCCVCRPLDAPRCFNWSSRRRYVVVVFVAAFAFNVPRYLDSCVARWVDPCGAVVTSIDLTVYRESFLSPIYYNVYIDGLYLLLLYVGPLTTLVYMNVRLAQTIRQSRRRHNVRASRTSSGRTTTWSPSIDVLQSPTTATNSDKNATVVLIIIVVVFVVCETPELIHKLVTFTERNFSYGLQYSSHGSHLFRLNVASELLMVVNSSVNFIVYVAFGRRFRRILRETFRFSFHFSGSATALTHDQPLQGGALITQRLQYHHNCVHVHKLHGGGGQAFHRRGGHN